MQLIACIQIQRKLFKENYADLIISERAPDSEKVKKHLEEFNLFNNILILKDKEYLYTQSNMQDLKDVFCTAIGYHKKYRKLISLEDISYTHVFYFNFSPIVYLLLDANSKNNMILCRVEEGIHSYDNMLKPENEDGSLRIRLVYKIRKLLRKPCIFENTKSIYVFFNDIFPKCNKQVNAIPIVDQSDKELYDILSSCFETKNKSNPFKEKYIFFGSSRAVDGKSTNETEIVKEIANVVGKENLVIKMHPRDNRDVYTKYGIKVSRNSGIPWEVAQLTWDFSNHVFVTVSSGSFISSCALLNESIPSFLLFPLELGKDKEFDQYCKKSLQDLINVLNKRNLCTKHKVVNDINEITKY